MPGTTIVTPRSKVIPTHPQENRCADFVRDAESALNTHDIAFRVRLPSLSEMTEQVIRFLIATPSYVTPEKKDATLERLERHASTNGGRCCAVIFYISPLPKEKADQDEDFVCPLHAFNEFQILLMQSRINIPLLPLSDASALAGIISTFSNSVSMKTAGPNVKPVNAALDVLPFCTTDAPMRQETLVALTDQTTCLRDVASLCGEDAPRLVEGGMSEEDVARVLEFWTEEWVVE